METINEQGTGIRFPVRTRTTPEGERPEQEDRPHVEVVERVLEGLRALPE